MKNNQKKSKGQPTAKNAANPKCSCGVCLCETCTCGTSCNCGRCNCGSCSC